MTPSYYRAYAIPDCVEAHIDEYYTLYSTEHYDFCTQSEWIAKSLAGKPIKEIREAMKQRYNAFKLHKIAKKYSRRVRPTLREAITHLIQRQHKRAEYLKRDTLSNAHFLNNAAKLGVEGIITATNKLYSTYYT